MFRRLTTLAGPSSGRDTLPRVRTDRIQAFDWLRGLAVLFMIQCHAMVLLRPELLTGRLFHWLNVVDGLVAPAFLLAAGFSLALVQVRSAAVGTRQARILKSLRRIIEVLLVATVVNGVWYPIFQEPKWLLRIDILHCVGLSLLVALPILGILAPRPTALRWLALGLAGIAFGVAPLAEHVHGLAANFVNISTGSLFPLFPWAGYVYLGASAGAVAAAEDFRALWHWVLALLIIGLAVWQAAPIFLRLYPPHVFWLTDPANHGHRWVYVCVLILALALTERVLFAKWKSSAPFRFLGVFGTSSLAAYFFHQMLLNSHLFGYSFSAQWGNRCGWARYWVLTSALIGLTYLLSLATDNVYRWVKG